jgi:hypothetical protein
MSILNDPEQNPFRCTDNYERALIACEREGITPEALAAYAYAKNLAADRDETLKDGFIYDEDRDEYSVFDELAGHIDSALDEARDFVIAYYDDVQAAAVAIYGEPK